MTESRNSGWYSVSGFETGVVSDWIGGVVLVTILVFSVLYRLVTPHLEYGEFIDEIHEVRRQGDISRTTFEGRLDLVLTSEQKRIRKQLIRSADIRPETGTKIARRFESVEQLRAAETEEIAATPGVRTDTAARISNGELPEGRPRSSRAHGR